MTSPKNIKRAVKVAMAAMRHLVNSSGFSLDCIIGMTTPMPSKLYMLNPTAVQNPFGYAKA